MTSRFNGLYTQEDLDVLKSDNNCFRVLQIMEVKNSLINDRIFHIIQNYTNELKPIKKPTRTQDTHCFLFVCLFLLLFFTIYYSYVGLEKFSLSSSSRIVLFR